MLHEQRRKPLILFVDDSLNMRQLAESALAQEGFDIVTASGGEEACAIAPRLQPDIVIADVIMPSINGYEVCRSVKARSPMSLVVLLSGTYEPFDPDEAERSGTDSVAVKPFEPAAFAEKLWQLLDSRPSQIATRHLMVFLCHAKEDKEAVRQLYEVLLREGFTPWLDEKDLMPGQNWDQTIQRVIRSADAVVVCLSTAAVSKSGYVQKEISFALDALAEKPEESIFLVPLLMDDCPIPWRLRHLHAVRLADDGVEKVIRTLRARQTALSLIKSP